MKWVITLILSLLLSLSSSNACIAQTTHNIEITGFKFVPTTVNLTKGDKVTWVNRDSIPHNIINNVNEQTLSPSLAKGDTFSYIVIENLNYACGFHPSMRGSLLLN